MFNLRSILGHEMLKNKTNKTNKTPVTLCIDRNFCIVRSNKKKSADDTGRLPESCAFFRVINSIHESSASEKLPK